MIYATYIFNFTKVQVYIVYIDTYTYPQTQEEHTLSIDYGFEFQLMGLVF